MQFIHQEERYTWVDLSRKEKEREKREWKKNNEGSPPLLVSGPAGAAGLRSRFSKVRHLVLP